MSIFVHLLSTNVKLRQLSEQRVNAQYNVAVTTRQLKPDCVDCSITPPECRRQSCVIVKADAWPNNERMLAITPVTRPPRVKQNPRSMVTA